MPECVRRSSRIAIRWQATERWEQIWKTLRHVARLSADGGMAEWLKAAVLKTARLARVSGVRIPLPPPQALCNLLIIRHLYDS